MCVSNTSTCVCVCVLVARGKFFRRFSTTLSHHRRHEMKWKEHQVSKFYVTQKFSFDFPHLFVSCENILIFIKGKWQSEWNSMILKIISLSFGRVCKFACMDACTFDIINESFSWLYWHICTTEIEMNVLHVLYYAVCVHYFPDQLRDGTNYFYVVAFNYESDNILMSTNVNSCSLARS